MDNFRKMTRLKRHVLIVDDEPINRAILGNILCDLYEVSYAENGQEALDQLNGSTAWSLVLLDLLMPVMDGFTLLTRMRESAGLGSIPVIVMTSEKDAEVRSIRLGAADFITKPFDMPEVIRARCERIIELSEGKNIIRSAEKDTLTGLYTKDFFFEYIRQLELYNQNHPMDVICFDVDHFNLINELYGRKEGDTVLRRIGQVIGEMLEDIGGIACRLEADCFYAYVEHQDSYEEVLASIHTKLEEISHSPKIRVRIGIYQNVDRSVVPEHWFDRARIAGNRMKKDFNRLAEYYSTELYQRTIYHEKLINDIDRAIENRELIVYYQPKYNVEGDTPVLCSAEALIRWKHPEFGMVSPGDFIPLFESNGLIQRLDHYVWKEAGAQVRKWKETCGWTVPVSVNVSRIDIYDPLLKSKLISVLQENSLSPSEFMLEITESAYSDNEENLIRVVDDLRKAQFRIEMDDFGSGYSSLNMLTTIPIDVLKLDMKFVRYMMRDEKSLRLVELVMDIARFLKVPVVAEGVEDAAQLEKLKKMGCQVVQGFYFSKPVEPGEFVHLIEAEKARKAGRTG